ncbi:hypothetical protein [Pseudoalteromonas luteoviolacea]|uniref:Uncharacterized protein n=1 Tax=Pseudoalteromonas luteoviolacea S4054 TaxID=1129367 RepID=A0A0F6AED7_9GAMM|nr:hypothetical protein [Pseudoalteromonas luteoviolacea]AOT08245.1 hypothetical protein S4054249_10510 [Pseudoalteromonas luteoviolacea]AOT13161.1 hypothetical protein S40542_10485 [Pseudoalteromonas luteoviolacea]AOT18073.1 hypothetical protein S4054_10480 [Pseudoalteromonas luteoviolacea]KKE84176.1 hypothetical protein N479_09765 [Pseudoalteromonas luteoviolacea S4054]KZN76219.1 hypothetical protein N481_07650 [Pseudoalteromonas luteoviolacea S4047-1]
MDEPKRIKKLRARLIKELPFFPNDRVTRDELENQSLENILLHYLHWKTRIVPQRERKVQISPHVTGDKRWSTLKGSINAFLEKVRNGEDLYPFHSLRAHKYGYTPAQRIRNGDAAIWEDKDLLLNSQGFHHFHLNMNIQSTGLSERTDDVLFAFVSRAKFHAIGIFNHDVFEPDDGSGHITPERKRMLQIHDQYMSQRLPPGTAYITNPISMSGHPSHLVRLSIFYADKVCEIDTKLDDRLYINSLYKNAKIPPQKAYNFEWDIHGLDLVAYDKKADTRFVIVQGFL